jgi:hypothetical protein
VARSAYYLTVAELVEKLRDLPADSTVLGLVGGGDDGLVITGGDRPIFSVADVSAFLNDAGRIVAHLTLFDYSQEGGSTGE